MRNSLFYLGVLACTQITSLVLLAPTATWAQSNIVPDDTLGPNQSRVTPTDAGGFPIDVIDGGVNLGGNMFHSFSEFNVDEARGVYFLNDSNSLGNILSRITGNNPSEILGTLGILNAPDIISEPNLLLINPNGVLFGPNSSLDVPAAFVVTTADAIELGDKGLFSATQPETSRLLEVNPSALVFNQAAPGAIVNQAVDGLPPAGSFLNGPFSTPSATLPDGTVVTFSPGLQVSNGQRLALVGGNIFLDEGILTSVGGAIDVGSVVGPGSVKINLTAAGFTTDYTEVEQFGNINLSSAFINANGPQGGRTQLQAARIFTDENNNFSLISANTQGDLGEQEIFLRTTEELFLDDASVTTVVEPGATGDGGNIRVESPRVFIRGGASSLVTRTFGNGQAGDVNIQTDTLMLREGAEVLTNTSGSGNGGNLTVIASDQVDAQGEGFDPVTGETPASGLRADIQGTGVGGAVTVDTQRLILRDGAIVSAITDDGVGGSVDIRATESVNLSAGSAIRTRTSGAGDAGDIRIRAPRIRTEASEVSASALPRNDLDMVTGDAGNLEIVADESVEIDGFGGYINAVIGAGDGGNLTIQTPYLALREGGLVSSETITSGQPGEIRLLADVIEVEGMNETGSRSQITASGASLSENQPLGNLDIQTRRLAIRDGGEISVNSIPGGVGPAGNLQIQASESIEVTGRADNSSHSAPAPVPSRISATTSESAGGNITLSTPNLSISDQAEVTVSSQGTGTAGNIDITGALISLDTAGKLVAVSPSGDGGNINLRLVNLLTLRRGASISTSAGTAEASGDGGNIDISAADGFVVAVPEENSDITANAFLGEGGRVDIQAREVFGLAFRPRPTKLSDITASSEFGVSGIVEINTLDTGFIEDSLTELTDDLLGSEDLVASSCIARSDERESRFVIANADNLPEQPGATSTVYPTGDIQSIHSGEASENVWQLGDAIIEPQEIYPLADGRLVMGRECQ